MDPQLPNVDPKKDRIKDPLAYAESLRAAPGTGFGKGLDFFDAGLGEPLENFTSYGVPASPMLDLHEERAQNQSRLEKWGNGTAKMITTFGGSFVDGTAGILAGIIQSVGQWDKSKFYDNVVGNGVDSMNEWMQEHFPNYYTQKELNTKGFASMKYANFWADKVTNGVGYMAGMIASTAAGSGLLSLGSKALKGSSLALKAHKVTRAAALGGDAADAIQGSARMARVADASKTALIGFTSAFAEAGVEARELLRRKETEFLEEAAKAQGVDISDLSLEARQEAEEKAKGIANAAFALNSIVVGAGNVIVFGNMLRPKYLNARQGFGKGIDYNAKKKLWEDTLSQMSTGKRLYTRFGKPMARGAVVESFQESTQYAIQEGGAEAMVTSNSIQEAVEAWGDAYSETFSTKEGIDSTLVGAVVGILGGGVGAVRRHYTKRGKQAEKIRSEKRAELVKLMNDPDMLNFMQRAEKTQGSIDISGRMQKALKDGDHKTYRDLQAQLIAREALQFADAGRLDLLYEKLDEALNMDDATFRENFGVPESVTEVDKNKLVNGVKERVKDFIKIKDNFDAKYKAPTRPGRNASKEELTEWAAQTVEFDFLRNEVLGASFTIEDIDGRITNLISEFNEMTNGNLTEEDVRLNMRLVDGELRFDVDALNEKLTKTLDELAETNPQNLDQARDVITDLGRLAKDRSTAVRAINELQFDPEMRDVALARRMNRQDEAARKERSDAAVEKANNATTEEEIDKVLTEVEQESGDISAEAQAEIGKRQQEIASKGRKLEAMSLEMSVAELEALEADTQDAVEKKILARIITERKENGQFEALIDVEEENRRKKAEALQEEPEGEVTEEEVNVEEELSPKAKEAAPNETDIVYKNNTYRVKYEGVGGENTITNLKSGKQIQTTSSVGRAVMNLWIEQQEQNENTTTPTESDKQRHQENRTSSGGVVVANGELTGGPEQGSGRYRVEVDENGQISTGNDANQKEPDGTPLNINRQYVKETPEDQLIGTPIVFRAIDTEYSTVTAPERIDDTNRPVGIYAQTEQGEILIGVLPAAKRTDSEDAVARRKAIATGAITEGRIAGVHAGNVITTVDETGERVFFPVNEAIGEADVLIGTVRNDGTVRVSKELDEADPERAEAVEDMGAVGDKLEAGRIVLISPRPGVGQGIKVANTAKMDGMAVQAVLNLLAENSKTVAADIREIVGLSIDPNPDQEVYMQKEPLGNVVVYFKHKSGDFIQITGQEISKALKNEFFLFQIGKVEPLTETQVLESGEEQENIILDPVTGAPKYRFQSESRPETEDMTKDEIKAMKSERKARYEKLRPEFLESLEEKLLTRRRQVSIEDAYNNRPYVSKVTGERYDSYLDYLSSPKELEAPQLDRTSIVSVDGKSHNGSFYYDVQVKIDIFESDPTVSEEVVSPKPKQSTKDAAPKPAADLKSLRSETARKKKRRLPPSTAEQKGEQNKKDCK